MTTRIMAPEGGEGGGGAAGAQEGAQSGQRSIVSSGTAAPQDGQQNGAGTAADGAVKESFWRGLINEDGTINHSRYDHLPDDLKDVRPLLERVKTTNDLVKLVKHQASLIGRKRLAPLPPNATEAEKKEFDSWMREVLVVPPEPKGYGLTKPDDLPDELWDGKFAEAVSTIAHKHAASPALMKELGELFTKTTRDGFETQKAASERALDEKIEAESKKLDLAFGHQRARLEQQAVRGAKWAGIDPNSPLFTQNADIVIACAKVAESIKEAAFVDGDSGKDGGSGDPEAALNDMQGNPANKYHAALLDPNHPSYQAAVMERRRLSKLVASKRLAAMQLR